MRQPATLELYSYWNLLRGARLSPEREEVDPLAIRHILADTMMLEADEARTFPMRISGTASMRCSSANRKTAPSSTCLLRPNVRPPPP